jgi:hypothetical protein
VLVLTRPEASTKNPGWREHRRTRTAMASTRTVTRFKLVGANRKAEIEGETQLPGRSNYLIGRDPSRWHTGVENFARTASAADCDGNFRLGWFGSSEARSDQPEVTDLATDPEGLLHRPIAYQMATGINTQRYYAIRSRPSQLSWAS